jgi:two-component system, chemotaxis family, protein-glutamate methylesterase/glutaminase
VLSGMLDDAALGSATVERRGGVVVVQDPADADYGGMPRNAIAATERPIVTPAAGLAGQVISLTAEEAGMPLPDTRQPDDELSAEIAGLLAGTLETNTSSRTYSGLSCPDCGGPLYAAHEERAETFDCVVGHRWSPQSLVEQQSSAVERALWLAVRSLEERGALTTRLAREARERGHRLSATQFSGAADEAQRSADMIREVVQGMTVEVAAEPERA